MRRGEISVDLPTSGVEMREKRGLIVPGIDIHGIRRMIDTWPGKTRVPASGGPRIPAVGQHHAECSVASARECEPGIVIRA